jgi:DNA-binding response OmpR family regulator
MNPKALLVCRSELLRESVEMYLDSKGFKVWATATYEAALKYLSQHTSDLIISEHGRSSADALKFFREIKKRQLASRSYKVIICDSCNLENEYDGLKQHADFCIPKPLTKKSIDWMFSHLFEFYGKKK